MSVTFIMHKFIKSPCVVFSLQLSPGTQDLAQLSLSAKTTPFWIASALSLSFSPLLHFHQQTVVDETSCKYQPRRFSALL